MTYGLDLPTIVSVGGSYTGLERWVFAADVRYVDYSNARGLGDSGFAPDGSVRGPGWKSIFGAALGSQYQLTDAISLRAGYSWSENPVADSQSFVNTVAPAIIQHNVTAGLSWNVTQDFAPSLAYVHGFENSVQGPVQTPSGPLSGTSVRNTASLDSVLIGAAIKFGGPRRSAVPIPEPE